MPKQLGDFLKQQGTPADLTKLLMGVANACVHISSEVRRGALAGILGEAGSDNVQGEHQKKLDVIANDILLKAGLEAGAYAVASEEMEAPVASGAVSAQGLGSASGGSDYLLLFDPLDGSSNIDVNVTIGTIFSVLRKPQQIATDDGIFLQPGTAQIAAGYVTYGPATQLLITLGKGTAAFTLDQGQWWLTTERVEIPADTKEFAINASNARHWEAPVKRYIDEMLAGKTGPLGKDYNMRWIASMVADVHRVLTRGGTFMYPRDAREPGKAGKLRLMYEANPMSFLVEQAGGASTNGHERIMEMQPTELHQRVAVFMGSRNEIERVTGYHKA